jgi:hypothetical protein
MITSARIALSVIFITGVISPNHHAGNRKAPRIIVLGGGPLAHRVVMQDWSENMHLLAAARSVVQVAADSLRDRPRISVAMYWGEQWRDPAQLLDSVGLLATLDGGQAGAFYPAFRGRPALWVFGAMDIMPGRTCIVTAEGLKILAKHGVPVESK